MKKVLVLLLAVMMVFGLVAAGTAAEWKPTKPIEIVAPAGPGGGWDLLARTVKKALEEEKLVDQPIIITNMPGGGGATGWTYLKGKKGQGEYLAANSSLILLNNLLGKSDLTFRDFTVVANLQAEWETVGVKADAPYDDLESFFAALKEKPETMPVGVGPTLGNDDHIQFLMLAKHFGVNPADVRFVVYPETAAGQIPALLGGHIKAITISLAETLEQARAGNMKLLGVSSPERLDVIPDVPTYIEQGVDLVFPHWRGLMAPPGLSEAQIAFWKETIDKMVASKTWKESLETLGWDQFYQPHEEYQAYLAEQEEEIRGLLQQVGLIKQ
ncbi:MAG: Putative lipoprotein [Synergistales bacterium 53_16]|nr:MAG: Putative lipoprotein [Synergistales bacterium 53_16]